MSIEAIRRPDNRWEAYTDNGRNKTGKDAVEWAAQAAELGAGELLVTSIDREGTGKGFELDLVRTIADQVGIPVIACGGAGSPEHAVDVVATGHADAVALASVLHYALLAELARDEPAGVEGNVEFLRSGRAYSPIKGASLADIKAAMLQARLECRPPPSHAQAIA